MGLRTTFASEALLDAVTSTSTGESKHPASQKATIHAYGQTTAATGAATIVIEVSNLEEPTPGTTVDWLTAATIDLTLGTTRVGDGFVLNAPWRTVRARVSALSGTGAAVSVRMGS